MSLWKRGKQYWLDAIVHGHRYREPVVSNNSIERADAPAPDVGLVPGMGLDPGILRL